MKILYIDDVPSKIEAVKAVFKGTGFDLCGYWVDWRDGESMEDVQKRHKKALLALWNSEEEGFEVVVADRSYYRTAQSELEGYERALLKNSKWTSEDLFLNKDGVLESLTEAQKEKVCFFALLTYNKDLPDFTELIENYKKLLSISTAFLIYETSRVFYNPLWSNALYLGYEERADKYHIHADLHRLYCQYIAEIALFWCSEIKKRKGEENILVRSFGVNIRIDESLSHLREEEALKGIRVSQVTFLNEVAGQLEHIIDMPYKDYFRVTIEKLEDDEGGELDIYKEGGAFIKERKFAYYDYTLDNNEVVLFDFHTSHEEQSEKLRDFLSTLHLSNFYDNQITVDTTVRKEDKAAYLKSRREHKSIKIFFLFRSLSDVADAQVLYGKNILSYSAWLYDDKDYTEAEVKKRIDLLEKLYSQIIESRAERSVVGSMNRKNSELTSERDVAERFRLEVLAHKHSFYQLDLKTPLDSAKNAIDRGEIEKCKKYLVNAQKELKLLRVINAGVFDKSDTKSEIAKTSISKILDFILENYGSGEHIPTKNWSNLSFVPLESHSIYYFTLFFNLWKNASRKSGFEISSTESNNDCSITFQNNDSIPEEYADFINGKRLFYPSKDDNKKSYRGLQIVKDISELLKVKITVDNTNNKTIFTLYIIKNNE